MFFVKGQLSRTFKAVALGVSLFAMVGCKEEVSEIQEDVYEPLGHSLTIGEGKMISNLDPLVDPSIIYKEMSPDYSYNDLYNYYTAATATCYNTGRTLITAYGSDYHSEDYSEELDPSDQESIFRYGMFFHELVHAQQCQMRSIENLPPCSKYNADGEEDTIQKYHYVLNKNSRFSDFCSEQQARMVENYVIRFFHPSHMGHDANGDGIPDDYELLKSVIEEKFPGARKTRLAIESQNSSKYVYRKSQNLQSGNGFYIGHTH